MLNVFLMIKSHHTSLITRIKQSLFGNSGDSPATVRSAIQEKIEQDIRTGESAPLDSPEIEQFVSKLSRNAWQIVDTDIENLKASGHSENQIFEYTLTGAFTAGTARLDLVLEFLKEEK